MSSRQRKRQIPPHDYLSHLMIGASDPEQVTIVTAAAEQGEMNAQFALGLIYAEGRGIEPSPARAYYWFSRAGEQGDNYALTLRNVVQQELSLEQIAAIELELAEGQTRQ